MFYNLGSLFSFLFIFVKLTFTPRSFRVSGQTDCDSFPSVKSFKLHLPLVRYCLIFLKIVFEGNKKG